MPDSKMLIKIGDVPWSHGEIVSTIPEFERLYSKRPIPDNTGGMKAPHMFATWFMLRRLAPAYIIESGVFKGQGTWLLQQACPSAKIFCIDPNTAQRVYTSPEAKYTDQDFSHGDWSMLPKEKTVVFFDDHQDAVVRLQQCRWFGFRHVIFEDNYPASQGDCYSLKKAFAGAGFRQQGATQGIPFLLHQFLAKLSGYHGPTCATEISPNQSDAAALRQNLDVYWEFPPLFRRTTTRWGDSWDDVNYPTPEPLLSDEFKDSHPILWDEAVYYTWICYAGLKSSTS